MLTGLLTRIPGRFTYCVKISRFRLCFCFSMIWLELDSDGRSIPTETGSGDRSGRNRTNKPFQVENEESDCAETCAKLFTHKRLAEG